jgi:hypothetical protein
MIRGDADDQDRPAGTGSAVPGARYRSCHEAADGVAALGCPRAAADVLLDLFMPGLTHRRARGIAGGR